MDDPTVPDVKPDAKATDPTPEEALRKIREFLDRIVGAQNVEITDLLGNVYRIPGSLPARVEARFFRTLRDLQVGGTVEGLYRSGDPQSWVEALIGLLGDDAMIDAVDEAFVAAFPAVIVQARARAEEAGTATGNRPSDLFGMSEVALAMTPFVLGAIRAAKRLIDRLLPPTPTT